MSIRFQAPAWVNTSAAQLSWAHMTGTMGGIIPMPDRKDLESLIRNGRY